MATLRNIALIPVLGKPLVVYFGILTLLLFLFTALIAVLNIKGIQKIPVKWHPIMARVSIVFALIHALLAVSIYL